VAHQLPEGHSLGTLTIIRLLGSGGMADVYEALDNRLGRHVAVKVLPQEYSRNQDFIMRFEREVKASAALSHPNIVTVFEFGSEDSLNYYTMRLLNGGDLRDRITKGMTIVDVLTTMRGVLQAFQHAHSRGFVHRDVKPENIMYDEQGTPTLTDFGIAKVLDSQTQMTQTGMAVGTPRYISPEQATGKPVDGRSDLYSLGCILYEMLTGSSPYKADTPIATIFQHVNEPIPVLNEEYSNFQPLLEKLMAKAPETRMQSAEEALAYIDETFPRDWTGVFSTHTTQGMPVAGGQTPAVTPIRTQTVPATGDQDEEKTQLLVTGAGVGAASSTQAARASTPADDFGATVVMPKIDAKAAKQGTGSGVSPAIIGVIVLVLAAAAAVAYLTLLKPGSDLAQEPTPTEQEVDIQKPDVAPADLPAETDVDSAQDAAQAEAARKAKLEADRKAREAAELKAQQEADQRAAAQRKAREDADRRAEQEAADRAAAERKAREAAERAAAERKAREDAARKADAEQKAREQQTAREIEAERKAREQSRQQATEPAAEPAESDAEAARREAAEKRQAEEAAQRRRAEQQRREKERREAQQAEAERLQRLEAERIRAEQERQAQAEQEKAREEEERKKKLKKPVPVGF